MPLDFDREVSWWSAKAQKEETDIADEAVNRALRWREIERHLGGVRTILDVGGATGAFTIPLARRGFAVTHLDFSPAMLEIARQNADGVSGIEFVEGNAVDLGRFADQSFDLVLNTDGAISFCGELAEVSLAESCRVAARTVIVSVTSLGWMVPVLVRDSLAVSGRLLPAVGSMLENRRWAQEEYPENARLARGATQGYFGRLRAFTARELRALIEANGLRPLRVGSIGSLANLAGPEAVEAAKEDPAILEEFLDLCERFDREVMPDGPGTRHRAGVFAVAERP